MNRSILYYAIWFVALVLLQAGVFNHMYLFGFVNPQVYIFFLFIFPFYKEKIGLLLTVFLLGFFIDLWSNDGGIHAFALVFVAYIRDFVLKILTGKTSEEEVYNIDKIPSNIRYLWYFILVLIHHTLVFSIENFTFGQWGYLVLKIFTTSIITTLILIILTELVLKNRKNEW
jgi:hypothetical protein